MNIQSHRDSDEFPFRQLRSAYTPVEAPSNRQTPLEVPPGRKYV